jgi:hypothetical protein
LSPILESDLLFNYVGLFWASSNPGGSSVAFWVRTSPDGRNWSPWQTVQVEMAPGPLAEYDTYGDLIWADRANYVQFLGELGGAGEKPTVSRIGLTLLNPYDGPIVETGVDLSDGDFANTAFAAEADSHLEAGAAPGAVIGKPITFKREDWGADESLRFSGGEEVWPRSYVPTKKLVVHHVVTDNNYATVEDAKALVRAVYAYHARTLGWGDIGYNSLIDRFGNSYEGRRGRDGPGYDGPGGREILSENVVGGHAFSYNHGSSGIALLGTFCTPGECSGGGSPTAAMVSRLQDVLTWESQQHGINPQGNSDFLRHDGSWHRDLPNIVGHRDIGSTTCPGGYVYALLPQLRSDVAAAAFPPLPPRGNADTNEVWHLRNAVNGGPAELTFAYGRTGDFPLACDWDGDGDSTPGVVRGNTWYLRNSNSGGAGGIVFAYGRPGDFPICGDWDGNGTETPGVVRGATWFLRNSNSGGAAHKSFNYGRLTDFPVVGDWNGDGIDTPGVVRGATWFLRNSNSGGAAHKSFNYGVGLPFDFPVVGDWNGDGTDTPGVVRAFVGAPLQWSLRNSNSSGFGQVVFNYGRLFDLPIAGDWNGDAIDSPGVVRFVFP